MIRKLLFIFCCCAHSVLLSQIPASDSKKIISIIGNNFKQLKQKTTYPYSDFCDGCTYIPSLIIYKDTSGIVYNNEFLLFRHPLAYTDGREILKLINLNHVTVSEYLEFQKYVQDSIAREKLYLGLQNDELANDFLLIDNEKIDQNGFKGAYSGESSHNREKYSLNWDKKFSYSEMQFVPILADMYLPQPQRYYRQRTFDDRKFTYRYTDRFNVELNSIVFKYHTYNYADYATPTISNTYVWSSQSLIDRDIWNVLGQTYNILFPDERVIGINGAQANAFCNWKQQQIQKQFNDNGLNYKVVLSLPLKEELTNISTISPKYIIKSTEMNSLWRITVEEYDQFINGVRDSILTEELYYKIPDNLDKMKLLETRDHYFNEASLEYSELDPNLLENNRSYFTLKPSKKMERKYATLVKDIKASTDYIYPKFVYWSNDAYERSRIGNLVPTGKWPQGQERDSMYLVLNERDSVGMTHGLDLMDGFLNGLGYSSGVRAHINLSRFHHEKAVNIISENQITQEQDELIQGLSYDQAVAFYYWKYPIQFAKKGDDWHQYIIPSKEQFTAVQRGEKVVLPMQTLDYPSPVFRYVIHILQVTN